MVRWLSALIQVFIFPGLLFLVSIALLCEWIDRKMVGRYQSRFGPYNAGPKGVLQPLADLVKLFSKEDIIPREASLGFAFSPIFIPALSLSSLFYIPIAEPAAVALFEGDLILVLFLLTLRAALVVLAGISSGSKFAEFGGARAGLQMLGYEVPLTLAAVGPAIASGSLSLSTICLAQKDRPWYIATQPLGFAVFSVSALAELGRLPFDTPTAESELVAGWKTEYSGKRLALLRLADDLDLVLFGGLLVTLFLGGANPIWLVPPAASFLLKLILCICFLALLRASSARFEVGRMVRDLWVYLTPLALAQAALAAMWR